jgi:DNA-binding PadR family transcriptional regulator
MPHRSPPPNVLSPSKRRILVTVLRENGRAYGLGIVRNLERELGRPIAISYVYRVLDQLESAGLVSSKVEEGGPERLGAPKRVFRIEQTGIDALNAIAEQLVADSTGLIASLRQAFFRALVVLHLKEASA